MRFYLKLLVLIAIFLCAAQQPLWRALSEVVFDVRVAYVCTFGSGADLDRLVDDTQRAMALREGGLDTYLRGKRFERLLEQRLADAAACGVHLDEDQIALVREACQREAFGPPRQPIRGRHPSTLPTIEGEGW